jgi:hypothetical protein
MRSCRRVYWPRWMLDIHSQAQQIGAFLNTVCYVLNSKLLNIHVGKVLENLPKVTWTIWSLRKPAKPALAPESAALPCAPVRAEGWAEGSMWDKKRLLSEPSGEFQPFPHICPTDQRTREAG